MGPARSDRLVLGFWTGEVWGRRRKLIQDPDLWLATVLAVSTVAATSFLRMPLGGVVVDSLIPYLALFSGAGFVSAVIGLGSILVGLGEDRVRRWSAIGADNQGSAFSNLVFVFAWAATAHVGLAVIAGLTWAVGAGNTVLPESMSAQSAWHYVAAVVVAGAWWYAVLEALAMVRTFVQVASVILKEVSAGLGDARETSAARSGGAEHPGAAV